MGILRRKKIRSIYIWPDSIDLRHTHTQISFILPHPLILPSIQYTPRYYTKNYNGHVRFLPRKKKIFCFVSALFLSFLYKYLSIVYHSIIYSTRKFTRPLSILIDIKIVGTLFFTTHFNYNFWLFYRHFSIYYNNYYFSSLFFLLPLSLPPFFSSLPANKWSKIILQFGWGIYGMLSNFFFNLSLLLPI